MLYSVVLDPILGGNKYIATAKAWEIAPGNFGGITARGKRFAGIKSLAAAKSKAGVGSKAKKTPSKGKGGRKTTNKKRSTTIPLALTIGASAGFFMGRVTNPGAGSPVSLALEGKGNEAFHALAMNYLGIDTWSPRDNTFKNIISRAVGLKALIIGVAISLLASKLGVNRKLGQAKLPYIRI